MNKEDFIPNERLRRARSLKGWSQTELAEQVGTSFEMVSRWERGVTIPSHYYRERLSSVLDKTAGELGLTLNGNGTHALPPSSLVFLASSHVDAEKEGVSYLKSSLQERGFTLWDSRQIVRQGGENSRTALREAIRAAEVILVILSPQAHSSRHVRETLELARRYVRPVYGVWIEGENWRECLPKGSGELAALIDARGKDATILFEEVATVLKRMELVSSGVDISTSARPDAHIPAKSPDVTLQRLNAVAVMLSGNGDAPDQRAAGNETLAAVLVYLRASLHGVILDTLRTLSRPGEVSGPVLGQAGEPGVEDQIDSNEIWEVLQTLLPSAREQRLIYLLYHYGLLPREILHCCPQEWSDVQEIYRLRRKIIERLLRHADSIRC